MTGMLIVGGVWAALWGYLWYDTRTAVRVVVRTREGQS